MRTRGIFAIFLFLAGFGAAAGFNAPAAAQQIRFTMPPDLGYLNVSSARGNFFSGTGAYFDLVREIFAGTGITPQFTASESYNEAMQSAMSTSGADFVVGAVFDERLLGRIDFVPVPILIDSVDIIINEGGKHTRGLDMHMLRLLEGRHHVLALTGLNLPILRGIKTELFPTVDTAMEEVLSTDSILVMPSRFTQGFLDKNAGLESLAKLKINRHSRTPATYFIAANRARKNTAIIVGGRPVPLFDLLTERLGAMESDGRLKKIMLEK